MDPVDEDENLFELEIKNLDTNEVFKLHIPIGSGEIEDGHSGARSQVNNPNYASKRKNEPSIGNIMLTGKTSPQQSRFVRNSIYFVF